MDKLTILFFVLLSNQIHAQINFDNTWVFGSHSNPLVDTGLYNGTLLDFGEQPPKQSYFPTRCYMRANAVISDSVGNLLFYSNGCSVFNKQHDIMMNGEGINASGPIYIDNCITYGDLGYPVHRGVMIIPDPVKKNIYYLFHLRVPDFRYQNKELMYTVVDMSLDGGKGGVTEKNQLIYADSLTDLLTAVRHANGRDWWIAISRFRSPDHLMFLFSPTGISGPLVQSVGGTQYRTDFFGAYYQGVFSPDGSKFAINDIFHDVRLYDFDRCTGTLSNLRQFRLPVRDSTFAGGIAFALKSRYLYASVCEHATANSSLFQFDTRSEDVAGSIQRVYYYEGQDDIPRGRQFYLMQLGPDGKIYITNPNQTRYLHIIHQPDKFGIDADIEMSYQLLTYHVFAPPNIPYFRLFDEPGTVCDSLGINGPYPPLDTTPPPKPPKPCSTEPQVYPNPMANTGWIELPGCKAAICDLYDLTGRWIRRITLSELNNGDERHPLDVSGLPSGVYLLRLAVKGGEVQTFRLAVMR
jgi:hypothetical protein